MWGELVSDSCGEPLDFKQTKMELKQENVQKNKVNIE